MSTLPANAVPLIACHECDKLHTIPRLSLDHRAACSRCGAAFFADKPRTVQRTVALHLGALALFALANAFPFLTLNISGREQPSHLISGAWALVTTGTAEVGAVVFTVVIAFLFLKIIAHLYVLTPMLFGRRALLAAPAMRVLTFLRAWTMPEVYLLGVIVAYVKLIDLAHVELDISLFCFVALIIAVTWASVVFEPRVVWERLAPTPTGPPPPAERWPALIGCHVCDLVVDTGGHNHGASCPRCGAHLHRRKHNSLSRTWALILASIIFYIPANALPVMTVVSLGSGQSDTILSGVQYLLLEGMWPLALLIFFASITVPMAKLIGLSYLLLTVRRRSPARLRQRTRLYRVIEFIGRWSMIDVFVVAILTALVQFGNLATITPGPGVVSFAAVVVLTMFAALSFDPRLIWDAAGANHDR